MAAFAYCALPKRSVIAEQVVHGAWHAQVLDRRRPHGGRHSPPVMRINPRRGHPSGVWCRERLSGDHRHNVRKLAGLIRVGSAVISAKSAG
jgi:hypothetical protein